MIRTLLLLGLLGSVTACGDGQPFFDDGDDSGGSGEDIDTDGDGTPDAEDNDDDGDGVPDGEDPDDDGDGVPDDDDRGGDGGPELPPGTPNPTASDGISRYEGEDDRGGGYVRDVSYDEDTDTFTVDNLAFDGDNVYERDDRIGTLDRGGRSDPTYAVYEASQFVRDPSDGDEVGQFDYRAIYGVSARETEDGEPRTRFAIVRTGSYVDYGFGGFVYERAGGVDLPTTGQASYEGEYAGTRIFNGRGGQEFTRGDVDIAIDFRDFNEGSGVRGTISNREAFTSAGVPIALGGADGLVLPDLGFGVGPGTVTEDGEMSNGLRSYTVNANGTLTEYEAGTYYAIIAGEDADEIVGIFVIESDDPRFDGVTAQETGGFIVYR